MSDGFFEFYPNFSEFLPVYQNVTNVWIGDGINTGRAGVIYVRYTNGQVDELGSVTMYAMAVEAGYQGSELQWAQSIIQLASLEIGANISVKYQTTNDGIHYPIEGIWTDTPDPQPGKYVWSKVTTTWMDNTTSIYYSVAYMGKDGGVTSVNGLEGAVVINGSNLYISDQDATSIKEYIDSKASDVVSVNSMTGEVFLHGENIPITDSSTKTIKEYVDNLQPTFATNEDIDALFE